MVTWKLFVNNVQFQLHDITFTLREYSLRISFSTRYFFVCSFFLFAKFVCLPFPLLLFLGHIEFSSLKILHTIHLVLFHFFFLSAVFFYSAMFCSRSSCTHFFFAAIFRTLNSHTPARLPQGQPLVLQWVRQRKILGKNFGQIFQRSKTHTSKSEKLLERKNNVFVEFYDGQKKTQI